MKLETEEDYEKLTELAEETIDFWAENGLEHERCGEMIERIGLINFIYTKKYKLGDVIKLLNNPNKRFDGIDGNFYFKDNMIERDLNILKINNGNSFVIN